MTASILANRRRVAPFGLEGGGDAAVGRNYVIRANGSIVALGEKASISMSPGDAFVIETPGGGAYGNR
jgi:5-oxoprolinase (ATP-hydrolysing)